MAKSLSLITFEGGEGAGKTTLIEALSTVLHGRGIPILKTRAPGGTGTGALIRELLLHPGQDPLDPKAELFLFLADRSQHVEKVIKPALQKGITVLCDRFNDSTLAYQVGGRGLEEKFVRDLLNFATGGLEPDLTFYLDLPPEAAAGRLRARGGEERDKIEGAGAAFHERVRKAYLELAEKEGKRFHVLDASKKPEEVLEEALTVLQKIDDRR